MTTGGDTIDLKGTWQYKVGAVFPAGQTTDTPRLVQQNQPTALYNAMIAPVLPMKIKGLIWYQGESNTANPEPYNALLPALIKDWRAHWNDGYLPFLVAQLPNFQDIDYTPAESNIALLREAQNKALTLPNTAVAVTMISANGTIFTHSTRRASANGCRSPRGTWHMARRILFTPAPC